MNSKLRIPLCWKEGGADDAARVTFAFRVVATRRPTPAELQMLLAALADYGREFDAAPKDAPPVRRKIDTTTATKNLAPRDLAAATALANVLLNLDEVTTRE